MIQFSPDVDTFFIDPIPLFRKRGSIRWLRAYAPKHGVAKIQKGQLGIQSAKKNRYNRIKRNPQDRYLPGKFPGTQQILFCKAFLPVGISFPQRQILPGKETPLQALFPTLGQFFQAPPTQPQILCLVIGYHAKELHIRYGQLAKYLAKYPYLHTFRKQNSVTIRRGAQHREKGKEPKATKQRNPIKDALRAG